MLAVNKLIEIGAGQQGGCPAVGHQRLDPGFLAHRQRYRPRQRPALLGAEARRAIDATPVADFDVNPLFAQRRRGVSGHPLGGGDRDGAQLARADQRCQLIPARCSDGDMIANDRGGHFAAALKRQIVDAHRIHPGDARDLGNRNLVNRAPGATAPLDRGGIALEHVNHIPHGANGRARWHCKHVVLVEQPGDGCCLRQRCRRPVLHDGADHDRAGDQKGAALATVIANKMSQRDGAAGTALVVKACRLRDTRINHGLCKTARSLVVAASGVGANQELHTVQRLYR